MSRLAGSRGLTLAEILLCVFILAVAILGLVSVQVFALKSRTVTSERLRAANAAAGVMAGLESQAGIDYATSFGRARGALEPGLEYAVDDQPRSASLRQLTITVYFRDLEGGRESAYTLQTLLHRR
ncbi:MAG: hypothetical protein AB7S38_08810 [Vulcanimicrobiota bacterium]